jgi:hypothetical protein
MKKIAIVFFLLISCFTSSIGQTASDSITMKKVFGGYQFNQGEQRLSVKDLVDVVKPNEYAYSQMKAAQSNYNLASVIGFAGGFMVGWPVGSALAGGDPEWVLAGIGAGLIVVSIPLTNKFNKQAKQAVESYNGNLQTTSFWQKSELEFCMTGNGVGLALRF